MKFIIDTAWLKDNLYKSNVRVVDCRFSLAEPTVGEKAYKQEHIPGAVYFDLEKDLSSIPSKHGGRHPLPKIKRMKEKLEKAGINNEVKVIAYDDGSGEYASRFWWILSYLGHKNVFVLNGGFQAWIQDKGQVDQEVPSFDTTSFEISINNAMLASIDDVKKNIQTKDSILIDSRASRRFLGLEEPIDKIAGRIPGAINKEWTEGFKNGYWKTLSEQKQRFSEFNCTDSFIVYCGSGVTATPNILALVEAGFTNVKLYAGSYSDWVSFDENPIEKG
ncbi:thiosulfate sulfurtransferase [Heyndrickxia sporothermodurans]|nr:thiosulfate sulfurtransferase [Heyndrickxia sporothermodurans]